MKHDFTRERLGSDWGANSGIGNQGANTEDGIAYQEITSNLLERRSNK